MCLPRDAGNSLFSLPSRRLPRRWSIFALLWVMLVPALGMAQSGNAWVNDGNSSRKVGLEEWKTGNYDTAKIYLERALSQFPNDRAVKDALIDTYIQMGRRQVDREPVEAIYWFERALQVDPQSGEVLYALGDAQYRQKNWDEAVQSLLQAEDLIRRKQRDAVRTRTRDALYMRGNQRVGYSDLQGARVDFSAALERSPRDSYVQLSFGYLEILVKRPKVALGRLMDATINRELHAQAEYYMGIAEQMLEHWVDSLPHFRAAQTDTTLVTNAQEGIARSQYQQSGILMRDGNFNEAEQRLVETTALRPAWPEGWFYLGQSRLALQKGAPAKSAFLEVQKIRRDYPLLDRGLASADVLVGLAHQRSGDHPSAKDMFIEALQYDATRGDAAYFLGESLAAMLLWHEAVARFRQAQGLGAYHIESGYAIGKILQGQVHSLDEALTAFEDVEQRSANYRDTRKHLIDLYSTIGEQTFAAGVWSRATKLLEKYFFYYPAGIMGHKLKLGIAYIRLEAWQRALKWLGEGLQEKPEDTDFRREKAVAHVGLADNRFKASSWALAVQNYEAARQLKYPDRRIELPLAESYRRQKLWPQAALLLRHIRDEKNTPVHRSEAMSSLIVVLAEWAESQVDSAPAEAAKLADEALALDGTHGRSLFAAGRAYLNAADWQTAVARLEKLYAINKSWPAGQEWLENALFTGGDAELKNGRRREAETLYLRMIAVDANQIRAYFAVGQLLFDEKKDGRALPYLNRAVTMETWHNPAALSLAALHFRNSHWLDALVHWDDMWKRQNSLVPVADYQEAIWQAANVYLKKGQEDKYLARLLQGVELAPQDAEWNWRYGDALLARRQYRAAKPYLEYALQLRPEEYRYAISWARAASKLALWPLITSRLASFLGQSEAATLSGLAYIRWAADLLTQDAEQSGRYARKGVELVPGESEGYFLAGSAYQAQEQWQLAIDWFLKLWQREPQYTGLSSALLRSYLRLAEEQLNAASLDSCLHSIEASKTYGSDIDQEYLTGRMQAAGKQREAALLTLLQVEKTKSGWRDTGARIEEMLLRLAGDSATAGKKDEALGYYVRYLNRKPDAIDIILAVAEIDIDAGRPQAAVDRLQPISRKEKRDNPTIGKDLGIAWCKVGEQQQKSKDWYNAREALKKGIDFLHEQSDTMGPQTLAECHYRLALVEQGEGRRDAALKEIEKALKYEENNEKYRQLRDKLLDR